ncbi:MAG: hypothetical protein K8S27_13310 [Candidatus Omnitrophica bacterium]|nr:hypothetical protein [Candidatus Omnitrophota bacterium]
MDKKNMEYFKKLLIKMKLDLIHDIRSMTHSPGSDENDSKDVSGHVMHMADVATDMYDREFNLGLASTEREILQKIDEALRRIEEGTFGVCLGTSKLIAKARLKAIPYAEYCLKYQEELENKNNPRG